MNLVAVLKFLDVEPSDNNCTLQNIQLDSRQVRSGDLFCAVPGAKIDGRNFVAQAIANGAAAVLVESPYINSEQQATVPIIMIQNLSAKLSALASFFYNNPSKDLKIIGITGTNGKTSCSHYIAQLLMAAENLCGVMGTLGNGFLPNLVASSLTTGDCCSVQQQLVEFKAYKASAVTMEVSSHALVQGRLTGTNFDTAIFTNLSQDHLDYHGNMQDYFAAKSTLFTKFEPRNTIINLDDKYAEPLLKQISYQTRLLTYSLDNPTADVYFEKNKIYTPWGVGILRSPLIGRFNVSNILACIACCGIQGLSLDVILNAVANLIPVPGRMQKVATINKNAPMVVIDYAHTPDALIKALHALREYKDRVIHCVFGCGGDRDRSKRPLMLQAVIENSDKIIITQDNPRTEDPQQIVRDMLANHASTNNISIELDRAVAITKTIQNAGPNDIILIAGKGHEDYQIIGTEKLPFSDLLVAQQALEVRSEVHG